MAKLSRKRRIFCDRKGLHFNHINGGLAQLGEHLPYKQRVTGSSPVVSTNKKVPFVV